MILRPALQKRYVELDEATLADQRTDLVRLTDAIEDLELTADLHVLRRLSTVLREADFKVTAVIVDEDLIDVEPGDTTVARYAIAFDLGTTTVVGTLLDVGTGTPLAVTSMLNKQQPFGGDVITRISATMMDKDTLGRLQEAAGATLAELADQVCRESGVDPAQVYEVAVAGNATMTALVLGIDPEPLGVAPFVMSSAQPPSVLASEIGLALHPRARAFFFPALGAYVGGDIVAGMLATGMDRDKRTRLFIDVGTNCEIVLSDGDTILSTAAPAGPAFEGGAIRCGMRAADGAIEVIKLDAQALGDDPAVTLGVIGDVEARGLCGSGLVDAVAELVRVGLLDATGRLVPDEAAKEIAPALADRMAKIGEERVFLLHRPTPETEPAECVYLSQRDVRELQFAKAAISTGLDPPARAARPRAPRRAAGAPCRVVRQLPLARLRGPDRTGPEAAGAADRRRRQRGRRGREDGTPVGARARRRGRPAGGGGLCRALRPPRLQRQVRRAARLRRLTASGRVALIACGALAQPAAAIAARHGWPMDVHPLPPLLHNHPQKIAGEVRGLADELLPAYDRVVIGYADCGTYGALDEVCRDLGLERLPGLHCYDLYAGSSRLEAFFDEQPGTYVLTDFLVRSFARTVLQELGLDRYPDLRDTYFAHYTRVVWLAQEPDDDLRRDAQEAADRIGLPLTVVETGDRGLETALAALVS